MDIKRIDTGGIINLELLDDTSWYWGMDCTGGDLYEAEELLSDKSEVDRTRLIFIHYPDGKVYEPVKAEAGQYFGKPISCEEGVFCLLVDFNKRQIMILKCAADMLSASEYAQLPLDVVPDCFNLMLGKDPLILVRQGFEGTFQVVWPEKGSFTRVAGEDFAFRDGDRLYCTAWHEDPDYREEVVVRKYPSGEIIERFDGALHSMPNQQHWLLL